MLLNKLNENIIEITLIYAQLIDNNMIFVEDSMLGKEKICYLAVQFENENVDANWDECGDYLEAIEEFAERELITAFSK